MPYGATGRYAKPFRLARWKLKKAGEELTSPAFSIYCEPILPVSAAGAAPAACVSTTAAAHGATAAAAADARGSRHRLTI